ncbi:MAG: tRNA (adenosine(37)-N6)-threonylcarbamoyltransferase complex dimerization subunit type 1 TsaB [Pseudomonadota bacterium]
MPPKPVILSFDTSAAHVAAALLLGDDIIADHFEDRARGQDQALVPVIENLLQRAALQWRDLDAIAVGIGPGNFTGVRISVALAKGLGMALQCPVIGVTTFDALHFGQWGVGYALVPAPRGGAYVNAQGPWPDALLPGPDQALALHSARAEPYMVGSQDMAWFDGLCADRMVDAKYPLAVAMARVAAKRLPTAAPGTYPKPHYIKLPDAAPSKTPAPQIVP